MKLPFLGTVLLGCITLAVAPATAQQQVRPALPAAAAVLDTLLDVGGHQLHFNVRRGNSSVILFESGGGDDLGVWKDIVGPVQQATGATIVTYDRAGFGKSGLDSTRISLNQQIADLKTGLARLKLDTRYLLVGHSFGGYLTTLFAARYSRQVQGAVLLDVNHVAYYTDARVTAFQAEYAHLKPQFRRAEPGKYWMLADAMKNTLEMRASPFPKSIPVVDMLAEKPPVRSAQEGSEWKKAHEQFVAAAPNRQLVQATGSGHYIMNDKPQLVIDAITRQYKASIPRVVGKK